jgi:hypothetical protein
MNIRSCIGVDAVGTTNPRTRAHGVDPKQGEQDILRSVEIRVVDICATFYVLQILAHIQSFSISASDAFSFSNWIFVHRGHAFFSIFVVSTNFQ